MTRYNLYTVSQERKEKQRDCALFQVVLQKVMGMQFRISVLPPSFAVLCRSILFLFSLSKGRQVVRVVRSAE